MKVDNIVKEKERANVPFDLAIKIRELLDDARKKYGPSRWDDDGVEDKIWELVTGDET
jgi:hypothetical protein